MDRLNRWLPWLLAALLVLASLHVPAAHADAAWPGNAADCGLVPLPPSAAFPGHQPSPGKCSGHRVLEP